VDVICHGDLHPFNLLVDHGQVTVLDWSAAILGPAAYDVAFTSLLLTEPPMTVPRPLQPVVAGAGRTLSRIFQRRYRSYSGYSIDPVSLRWHQGLVCLRVLVEVAGWDNAARQTRAGHPWFLTCTVFATPLTNLTGYAIAPK
jgi:aminoglycoside phosphotransferase (APT) family kinase protein